MTVSMKSSNAAMQLAEAGLHGVSGSARAPAFKSRRSSFPGAGTVSRQGCAPLTRPPGRIRKSGSMWTTTTSRCPNCSSKAFNPGRAPARWLRAGRPAMRMPKASFMSTKSTPAAQRPASSGPERVSLSTLDAPQRSPRRQHSPRDSHGAKRSQVGHLSQSSALVRLRLPCLVMSKCRLSESADHHTCRPWKP